MATFHPLRVKEIVRETNDSVTVELEVPPELKEEFAFTQGQYLTFRINVNGEELRRNYSLCDSPDEDRLRITSKKVEGGRVSGYLNEQLKEGEVLEVMPPMGNFHTPLDPSNTKEYVAFAGGSGITPVMSILKTVLYREPKSRFTLFYGNRDAESVIFRKDLDKLEEEYPDRLKVVHVFSEEDPGEPLFHGWMDKDKVNALMDRYWKGDLPTEFFICGPPPMIPMVREALEERGVEEERIHIEYFTSPADSGKEKETDGATEEGSDGGDEVEGVSQVTVIIDDEETTFELDRDGDSILDAGLDEGLDLPFSCKGAVCATCRAKLLEGRVEMDENHALPEEELEKGYILTCQSHPRTPKVKVDYDEI